MTIGIVEVTIFRRCKEAVSPVESNLCYWCIGVNFGAIVSVLAACEDLSHTGMRMAHPVVWKPRVHAARYHAVKVGNSYLNPC